METFNTEHTYNTLAALFIFATSPSTSDLNRRYANKCFRDLRRPRLSRGR